MELTIEHLAAYLPYGLKIIWNDSKDIYGVTYENEADYQKKMYPLSTLIFTMGRRGDLEWKPILLPLSDLTNEQLIPIRLFIRDIEKHNATYKDNIFAIEDAKAWIRGGMKPVLSLLQVKGIMEHLYSIHADIHGLIPANLAIDKNKINNQF